MAYDPNPSSGVGVLVAKAYSSTNVVVASGLVNASVVGSVTVATGDLVLLGGQTIPSENGLYTVVAAGAGTRSSKMAAAADASGVQVFIQQGSNSGTTYQQISNPAIVGTNSLTFSLQSQGSFAEIGGQTFTGGTWTNAFGALSATIPSTGSQITLPSAGTYLITGQLDADSSGSSTQTLRLFNVTTGLAVGSPAIMTGDAAATTHQGSATITAQVVTTAAGTIIRLEAKYNQVGSSVNGGSIYYQKIGGTSPIFGSSVDYVKGTSAGGAVAASGPFLFSSIVGSIPYSAGVFTLQAGKTYRLSASLLVNGSNTTMTFQWRNLTSATLIGSSAVSASHNNTGFAAGSQTIAETIITPTVATTVQLENTLGVSRTAGTEGTVFIEQIGNSAITQFVGATGTVAGAGGFVPAPAATDNVNFLRGDGTFSSVSSASSIVSTSSAAYTALTTDYHIRLILLGTQFVTLPAAASNTGRSYKISNPTIWGKGISSMVDETGANISYILDSETFVITSDGTNWIKDGGSARTVSKLFYAATGSYGVPQVSVGGLTFSITGGTTTTATTLLQARTVAGTTLSATVAVEKFTASNVVAYEFSNPSIGAGYTALHTALTAFSTSYQPFHLVIVDRTGGQQWNVDGLAEGSAGLNLVIKYNRA